MRWGGYPDDLQWHCCRLAQTGIQLRRAIHRGVPATPGAVRDVPAKEYREQNASAASIAGCTSGGRSL